MLALQVPALQICITVAERRQSVQSCDDPSRLMVCQLRTSALHFSREPRLDVHVCSQHCSYPWAAVVDDAHSGYCSAAYKAVRCSPAAGAASLPPLLAPTGPSLLQQAAARHALDRVAGYRQRWHQRWRRRW
jgi:hypothetical protein